MIRNVAFYALSLIIIVALLLGFNPGKQGHKSSSANTNSTQHLKLLNQQLAQPKNLRHKFKLEPKIYHPGKVSPGLMLLAASGSEETYLCLLYTSPSPRDKRQSRMPSSA